MEKRAYINWKTLDDVELLESGKKYMVAVDDGDGSNEVSYEFATWYKKGDTVYLECPKRAELGENATAEERLLVCIFGGSYPLEVGKDGFYIKTKDYGVDGEAEAEGCTEDLVWLGDKIFWSEVPIAPDGFKDCGQAAKERAARAGEREKAAKQEKIEHLVDVFNSDNLIKHAFPNFCKDGISEDSRRSWKDQFGGVHEVNMFDYANRVVQARQVYSVIEYMVSNDIFFDDVFKEITKDHKYLGTLFDAVSVDTSYRRDLIFLFMEDVGFVQYRRWNMEKFSDYNVVLIVSAYRNFLVNRTRRIFSLIKLGAPEVIRFNEFRIFAEYFAVYIDLLKGKEFDIDDAVFAEEFGVHTDGTRYVYTHSGDTGDEDNKDVYDSSEEEENVGEIGIDYPYIATVVAPNFLAMKGDFALYDNESFDYVKDDSGEYIVGKFDVVKHIRDELDARRRRK